MTDVPLFSPPVPVEPRKYEGLLSVSKVRMEPAAFSSLPAV